MHQYQYMMQINSNIIIYLKVLQIFSLDNIFIKKNNWKKTIAKMSS